MKSALHRLACVSALCALSHGPAGAASPDPGSPAVELAKPNIWRARQSIDGSSAMAGGLLTITDSVSGKVEASRRPDSVLIKRTYDGSQVASGYTSGGFAVYPFIAYGSQNPETSGSVALLGGSINIYNSGNGPAGRSEFTPLAVANVPMKGGRFAAGSNYYNDFNVQSAPDAGGQEGFLASGSFAVQKRTGGNAVDAVHAGSYGLAVTTVPGNIGFDSQNHRGDRTYPLNALITLNGWSGTPEDTSAGGQSPAATPAALVGLQIGGPGGSVWSCASCSSHIPTGIHIQDYSTAAIAIEKPNAGHVFSGEAITIASGGGDIITGDNIRAGSASGGGVVQGRELVVDAAASSLPAAVIYRDRGVAKWQEGRQPDDSFAIYDSVNRTPALAVLPSGEIVIGEHPGGAITLATMTTGQNAYALCASGSGQIVVQSGSCMVSSRRFKSILGDVPDGTALGEVMRLKPVHFTMKPPSHEAADVNYRRDQLGLVAEDVATVDPRAALYEEDGVTPKSYRQESIIALLVGAVKAQQAQIDELKEALVATQRR